MGNQIGEVVSVFIPNDKKEEFWEIITEAGYSKDGKGIFSYIYESFEDEETAELNGYHLAGEALHKWAEENPEQWENLKKKGSTVTQSLLNKIQVIL
jgi:hypothetical protein